MTAPERFADSQIPLAPRHRPYMTHSSHCGNAALDRPWRLNDHMSAPHKDAWTLGLCWPVV